MTVSLGGLASGMDTETVVTQLMALQRHPQERLDVQQRQASYRQGALRDIQSQLRSLRDASADLRLPATWADRQTATVSDATRLAARITGPAGSGSYELQVLQLARAEQRTFEAATLPPSFTVTTAGGTAYGVTVADGEDAAAVAARINADSAAPVYAVATQGSAGTRLVLTSRTSGGAGGFAVSAELTEVAAAARPGQDAQVRIDSDPTVHSSATNVLSGALPGVELTLAGAGTTTVTVSAPALDANGVVDRVKALVQRYNQAVDLVRGRLSEKRVQPPQTAADHLAGLLRADPGLQALVGGLRGAVGTSTALALGVGTGAASGSATYSKDAVAGRLTLDEAKLRATLEGDPLAARTLVQTLTNAVETVLTPVSSAGGTLDTRLASEDRTVTRLREASAALTARLDRAEKALRRQFANLEASLSRSQAQGQWLAGQINGLTAAERA